MNDNYYQNKANETGKPVYIGPDNVKGGSHWVYPQKTDSPTATSGAICEFCGTRVINDCLRCGAPQCCPNCCMGIFSKASRDSDSLIEKLPMSYAAVIQNVARDAINKCHCYGHLCGQCGDAKVVLDAVKHTHRRSENGDMCAVCGLDMRDDIHRRIGSALVAAKAERERHAT